MEFYISQLVETQKILPLLRKYEVGLEVVQFANPYILDNRYEIMENYKIELEEMYNNIDFIIHGPYADLCPGTRDNEIKKVTKLRMDQAYEVANSLGAKKVLYHNGYTPRTYTYTEWKSNVCDYWTDFMKGKNNKQIVIENVLDEDYELLEDLMNKVDNDKFSVCIDIGHINSQSKLSIDEWIDRLSYKLNHIHLHNNYGELDTHSGINKGNIDIINFLEKLQKTNNDVSVSLEITELDELIESLDILVDEGFINLR